jgi:biotin carboxyl carrier protein
MSIKQYFKLENNIIEIEFEAIDNEIEIKKIDQTQKQDLNAINLEIIDYKDNTNYTEVIFKIENEVKKVFILDNNIYLLEDNLIKYEIKDLSDKKLTFKNYTLEQNITQIENITTANIKNNVKKENNKYYLVPPLSGKIEKINVKEGDTIEPNTNVIIISAMKMENNIEVFEKYKVLKILVKEGDFVQINQNLIELELMNLE